MIGGWCYVSGVGVERVCDWWRVCERCECGEGV